MAAVLQKLQIVEIRTLNRGKDLRAEGQRMQWAMLYMFHNSARGFVKKLTVELEMLTYESR